MNTYPDEAAFARPNTQAIDSQIGLTKREYFAAMALQGMTANHLLVGKADGDLARWSVEQADALIDALNRQP